MNDTTRTLTDPKIDTVQRIYAAFGAGDIDTILAAVDDDVDWAAEATGTSAPWYGSHRGKDGVARFARELGTAVELTEFTPLSFTSNDTDVMVTIRWSITSRATGRSATSTLHHWWRFSGDKVVFYRGSDDSALTASVLS